jgi:hypothetical protein
MPSSSSSSNLPPYAYLPFIGPPLWVIFHPDEPPQPAHWLVGYQPLPSGVIPSVNAVHIYPPPGLTQPQQSSSSASSWVHPPLESTSASSWQQPEHLIAPISPHPVIPVVTQTQFIGIVGHAQLFMTPFLSSADISRLRAVGVFFRNDIPMRPITDWTSQDINSIALSPVGALFLNALISANKLTNIQIHYLDNRHLNLLDEFNLQRVLLPQNPNQVSNLDTCSITLTSNQICGLDMLHLFMLGLNGGRFRTLERENLLTGLQRDYINLRFLGALADATDNENYLRNRIPVNLRHAFSYEAQIVQQLFIMAAGTRNPDFLPGIGASSLLDAPTLSYLLPCGNYVVTELFSLYTQQNAMQGSDGQFANTHAFQTGNVSALIQGSTLNLISNEAFNDLAHYMNAQNAQIQFTPINIWGLRGDRFNQITDQTLFQAYIGSQIPTQSWHSYLQTHHGVNNWGELVYWLTHYDSIHGQANTGDTLNQVFVGIANFVRHRLTILQEIWNSMSEEQKAMFADSLGYHGQGGRRTQQTTADTEVGVSTDAVPANTPTLEQLLIQESLQEVRSDTKTNAFVRSGEKMNGKLENNQDHDWYLVNVKAGITYKFILQHTNNTDHLDPWLNLRDTNGKIIKSDDDSAGNLNSLIQFKATQNATYYLDACSWREISHGQFSLSVMSV